VVLEKDELDKRREIEKEKSGREGE